MPSLDPQHLEKWTELLMDINDVLVCLEESGQIVRLLGRVEELFGQPPGGLLGQDIHDIVADDVLTLYFQNPHNKIYHSRLSTPGRQGLPVSISVHRGCFLQTDKGFLLTFRDISEKLQLQESLKRVAILEYEKKRADQSEHVFSELIHNVKNRLVVIAGFANVLARHAQRLTPAPADAPELSGAPGSGAILEKIKKNTEQIFLQVRDTLEIVDTINKKTYWERESIRREINLNELIRTELQAITLGSRFRGVEKIVDLDHHLPPVIGVYADFSQVFVNIIKNGLEAMYDAPRKRLRITTACEQGFNIVEIADSGHGVPEALREKIFEPFFTTRPARGENGSCQPTGTGLGLSSTRRILGRYAGDIRCLPSPEGGAVFRVRIPHPREIHRKLAGLSSGARDRELLQLVDTVEYLPTVPAALTGILEAIRAEKGVKSIAELLATDYALLEKVLETVNSAYFGLRRTVTSCEEAIVFLGLNEVTKIVETVLVSQSLFHSSPLPAAKRLWHHSLHTALLADELRCRAKCPEAKELAGTYLATLLHDVGELVLALGFPADHHKEVALLEASRGIVDPASPAVILHPYMGRLFLKHKAGLDDVFLHSIQRHHHLPRPEDPVLSGIVFLADKLDLYYPHGDSAYRQGIQALAKRLLDIDPSELARIQDVAAQKRDFLVEKVGVA